MDTNCLTARAIPESTNTPAGIHTDGRSHFSTAGFCCGIAVDVLQCFPALTFSPRARDTANFHGLFYGPKIFCCKTAQFCARRRESEWLKHQASARLCKPVKTHAKTLS
jgi:hypothetical protein